MIQDNRSAKIVKRGSTMTTKAKQHANYAARESITMKLGKVPMLLVKIAALARQLQVKEMKHAHQVDVNVLHKEKEEMRFACAKAEQEHRAEVKALEKQRNSMNMQATR